MAEIETAWNGHYWRGSDGCWRYTISRRLVPGARDRLAWDGEHEYPRIEEGGKRYVVVPASRAHAEDYLRSICTHHSVLAEERDGLLSSLLVPEELWIPPALPHPEGGMWAPELESALIDIRGLAELMGFAGGPETCWPMVTKGLLPAPVVRKVLAGPMRGTRVRVFWTRPVITQYRRRYAKARPCPYDLAKKMATQRERRAAGLGPVKKRRRA